MKFPLRLSWDLWRPRFSQPTSGGASGRIAHLPAAMLPVLHDNGPSEDAIADAHSAAGSVRTATHSSAPVLWIGGSEPLDHSEVGRVAFALNRKGRNVFVHTNGQRLRQRIHEFHPEPRLFLTVELAGREDAHDRVIGHAGAFRRIIEGIRAAKLSGFHVCAHVTVSENTDLCETGELFEYLDRYDVDGYIVSSGGLTRGSASCQRRLEEVLPLVRCSRWENFSRSLEASYKVAITQKAAEPVATPEAETVEESA
jgi:sulfatase maturation enzyme AslB (radical SAM superfamily)